jgi:hypothetical protein
MLLEILFALPFSIVIFALVMLTSAKYVKRDFKMVFALIALALVLLAGFYINWYLAPLGGIIAIIAIVLMNSSGWVWKVIWGIMLVITIALFCILITIPTPSAPAEIPSATIPESCEAAPIVAPVVAVSCSCDPSAVPFTDMGELNQDIETVIVGPAIYEWWLGGELEGVQRVEAGYTVTIHGAMGHWWTLPSQAGLDCAWKRHVSDFYATKPQHADKTIAQLIISPPVDLIR